MASDSANQSTITMQDVLDEEQELQLETAAVLGGSDEKNCTYIQVYEAPDSGTRCGFQSSTDRH